jgi:hypothetical protein
MINNHLHKSDILDSPPLSTLPKDALLSNDFTSSITQNLPSATTAANSIIPIPSNSYVLKYSDSTFDESEAKVGKVPQQASTCFEKSQRRILKRLGGVCVYKHIQMELLTALFLCTRPIK